MPGPIGDHAVDRITMMTVAGALYGVPYRWGGKTPQGFDCSGFACELLMAVGRLPNNTVLSSRGLFKKFAYLQVENPSKGCLLFYGRNIDKITHVAVAIDSVMMYEAGGGDSKTRSLWDSIRKKAYVRRRLINRRPDLVAIVDPFM